MNILVLIITSFLFLVIAAVIGRAIIYKQRIIGRPPIPVLYVDLIALALLISVTTRKIHNTAGKRKDILPLSVSPESKKKHFEIDCFKGKEL